MAFFASVVGLGAIAVVNAVPGPTFGTGLAGIPICQEPRVVVNHTLSAGSSHGVLHHFWVTGQQHVIDTVWVEYYIDGEKTPSIAFQPAFMCGLAFPSAIQNTYVYQAGSACGKNAAVGGWFNTFPIPFAKSALVTVRNNDAKCTGGYINIRGTENLPVVLPGGMPLPSTARLSLQRTPWAVRQPLEYINITSMPSGSRGMVFLVGWAVESEPVGGAHAGGGYIEGCWHFYREHTEHFPGMVVGTGVEDYFDSGYYFGADSGLTNGLQWTAPLSGLPLFERTDTTERISAYRFHNTDPLVFTDGGALVWRVGAKGLPGTTKCGNPLPPSGPLPPAPPPVPPPPGPGPNPGPGPAPAPPPVKGDGCADGSCDAFCSNPAVRGCAATWSSAVNLRASRTGIKCGGSLGPCKAPADACAPGWELCLGTSTSTLSDFRTAMSAKECATGDPRTFVAAMSHSNPEYQRDAPSKTRPHSICPPSNHSDDNGCVREGWGCEPICCGASCTIPSCPDMVWPDATRIHIDIASGCCGAVSPSVATGVLCCKSAAKNMTEPESSIVHTDHQPDLGRQLTPINFTSYGWVYTW